MDFTEREKAIMEVAVQHFRTDCVTRGNFDAAEDATAVGEKLRAWRDEEAIPDHDTVGDGDESGGDGDA